MRSFAYARPESLNEALALLDEYGPAATILAGGTDVVVRLRTGRVLPAIVIDLKRVPALHADILETVEEEEQRRLKGYDGAVEVACSTKDRGQGRGLRLRELFRPLGRRQDGDAIVASQIARLGASEQRGDAKRREVGRRARLIEAETARSPAAGPRHPRQRIGPQGIDRHQEDVWPGRRLSLWGRCGRARSRDELGIRARAIFIDPVAWPILSRRVAPRIEIVAVEAEQPRAAVAIEIRQPAHHRQSER